MNEATVRRLAFIRYFYGKGVVESQQPEPLASIAILMFHDSVELFLQLACEFLDVKTKAKMEFMEFGISSGRSFLTASCQ